MQVGGEVLLWVLEQYETNQSVSRRYPCRLRHEGYPAGCLLTYWPEHEADAKERAESLNRYHTKKGTTTRFRVAAVVRVP